MLSHTLLIDIGEEELCTQDGEMAPTRFSPQRTKRQPKGHEESAPDMISFDPYHVSTESAWESTMLGVKMPLFFESGLMVWGGSRKMFDALHEYSVQGKAGYQSVFVPSVAYMEDLKLVWIDIRHQTEMYFCCALDADEAYLSYYINQTCLHTNLIHPVKNRGLWPS